MRIERVTADRVWWNWHVGRLPLPIVLLLAIGVVGLCHAHELRPELTVMAAVLALGGALCAWIGGLLPLTNRLGGPAICAAFLPSFLVFHHWLPLDLVASVTVFTRSTNFIYFYISAIVVGSILSMERRMLLGGLLRLAPGLLLGSASAVLLGTGTALLVGIHPGSALAMIVIPMMAGGVGEGAIPLSTGYSVIFRSSQTDLLGRILPVVLLANLVSIVFAGLLNLAGRRWPQLTGNGSLQRCETHAADAAVSPTLADLTPESLLSAVMFAVGLYVLGLLAARFVPLPAPIVMLFAAIAFKCFAPLTGPFCHAAAAVSRFTAFALTYPLLFAVAIALTPWASVRNSFHPSTIAVIVAAVAGLTAAGFFSARWVGLYPIEAAIVNACHTGAGGTGDVAILTAAERLELLPFAQVATRVGGAITVTAALLILRLLKRGY